jgi:predicted DCC family thiol-disulfide oxidoreductase YuxK
MTKETLFYDGACPLCAREMKHLGKLKRESLDLVDIHGLKITGEMPSKEDLLLNLHLKRGNEWVVGADANVAAWQHTRFGALLAWLRWPVIKQIVDPLYAFWAKRRYEGLYGDLPEKSDITNTQAAE